MSRVTIAVVAALEREIKPLVRNWRVSNQQHEGREFRFFEHDDKVVVCGGIGPEAARRAAEAVITISAPRVIYSVGFAGALDPALKVGDLVHPRRIVNASDGSSVDLGGGTGVLVSFAAVASPKQKQKLRESFQAQAVDMEAAAVARAAEARGVPFLAVKVISDEFDFEFPSMERFVDARGKFSQSRFAFFIAVRPWLWMKVAKLARDSGRASRALCDWLQKIDARPAQPAESLESVSRR
jgi:adenosylhomocysteine nucleosidase